MYCSRFRSTDQRTNTVRPSYQHFTMAGVPTVSYVYGSVQGVAGSKKDIADVPHPNFHKRFRRGEIVMGDLALSDLDQSVVDADFVFYGSQSWGYRHCWGDYACYTRPLVPDKLSMSTTRAKAAEIALVKVYAKANAPDIVGGETLNDLGATFGMIRHPLAGAGKLARRIFKRAKERNAARVSRNLTSDLPKCLADTWLEYRYGWRPLISDISSAMKLIHDDVDRLRERKVVRAGESYNATLSIDHTITSGMPSIDSIRCVGTHSIVVRAFAGMIAEYRYGSSADKIARALGLDSTALASTAWEVVPFSFVADWFVNTGAWLSAITPNPYLANLGVWVTTSCEEAKAYSMTGKVTVAGVVNEGLNCGSSSVLEKTLQRTINPPLPLTPTLTLKALGWRQALDSLSLLYQNVLTDIRKVKH